MPISDFFKTYFVDPFVNDLNYNIYNTLGYAIILILAVWGIYHLLKKTNIKIDRHFIISLIPFIAFGSAFRVWTDAGIVKSPFFITPGSYIVTASLVLASIFAGLMVQKKWKVPYYKIVFSIGSVLALIAISGLRIVNWKGAFIILGIFGAIAITTETISRKYKINPLYKFAFLAHMLDAAATFTATHFYPAQYVEQHVLSGWFIYNIAPWSFILLKAAIVIPVLYIISKSDADEDWKNLLLFAVITLGAAPGLRDFFRLAMGV